MTRPLAAVVLAAGLGTRMRSERPKHLHPLLGRRVLDWALDPALALDPARLVVVSSPENLDELAGTLPDGAELAVQAEPRGTGDAVAAAEPTLAGFSGDVLVLFSDHGWWYVVGAAVVAIGLYFLGRRTTSNFVHESTWILATSQLISVLVPVLWVAVKTLAIVVLVLIGLFFLAILLLDRGRK